MLRGRDVTDQCAGHCTIILMLGMARLLPSPLVESELDHWRCALTSLARIARAIDAGVLFDLGELQRFPLYRIPQRMAAQEHPRMKLSCNESPVYDTANWIGENVNTLGK